MCKACEIISPYSAYIIKVDCSIQLCYVNMYCATYLHLLLFPLFNPFPNKPWFLRVCKANLLKTLWEKEKLLVTSNFSFSHSVF